MAVTLLSISHADVLLGSRMINLPIVAIDVPTTLFLVLAPIVVAALYVNLHLYLGKLLHAFYHAPADVPKKWRLADQIAPSLINDYALTLKDGCRPRGGSGLLRCLVTVVTVWLAAPAVMLWAWYTSLLARDWLVAGPILAALAVMLVVGTETWLYARRKLAVQAEPAESSGPVHATESCSRRAFWNLGAAGAVATLLGTTLVTRRRHASATLRGHASRRLPAPAGNLGLHPASRPGRPDRPRGAARRLDDSRGPAAGVPRHMVRERGDPARDLRQRSGRDQGRDRQADAGAAGLLPRRAEDLPARAQVRRATSRASTAASTPTGARLARRRWPASRSWTSRTNGCPGPRRARRSWRERGWSGSTCPAPTSIRRTSRGRCSWTPASPA